MAKKQLNIINVGKIILDEKFTRVANEDHIDICFVDNTIYCALSLTLPGLKVLYAEIGDYLREFEKLRNTE